MRRLGIQPSQVQELQSAQTRTTEVIGLTRQQHGPTDLGQAWGSHPEGPSSWDWEGSFQKVTRGTVPRIQALPASNPHSRIVHSLWDPLFSDGDPTGAHVGNFTPATLCPSLGTKFPLGNFSLWPR